MGYVPDSPPERNLQEAPYPQELHDLVAEAEYRPGWKLALTQRPRGQGDGSEGGLTFDVVSVGYDSYHPEEGQTYRVRHSFGVPAATYNRESWKRWLLDRLIDVETHEACEFFRLGEERPFAPHHGPGNDPYIIFHHGDDVERRTSFRGEVKDG